MATITLQKNFLIVIILAACLVCCAVSAGISVLVLNSGGNNATGDQGEPGPTGQPGPTGAPGAPGATGASGSDGADGSDGDDGIAETNYDSGWVDIRNLAGQNITFNHNLNTNDLVIQIQGKDAKGQIHQKYLGLESATVQGWQQTYGKSYTLDTQASIVTSDDGYAVTGVYQNTGENNYQAFLLKMTSQGSVEWIQTYQIGVTTTSAGVIETSDGGFVIVGGYQSQSRETATYLLKTDFSGNAEWNQTYGGSYEAYGRAVIETSDGGYMVAAESDELGEALMLKTLSNGTLEWSQTYPYQSVCGLLQTADDGYVFAGQYYNETTWSMNAILTKITSAGAVEWNQTFSTTPNIYSVISTGDGGFALVGYLYSGISLDALLIKTDSAGTVEWQETYDIGYYDYGYSVIQSSDNGYVLTGCTSDSKDNLIILKTDADGKLQWNANYTSSQDSVGLTVMIAPDGGYTVIGYSQYESTLSMYDILVVRTFDNGTIYWSDTYHGQNSDYGYAMVATKDGGYAIAGYTDSSLTSEYDVYLMKTYSDGSLQWAKTYDFPGDERAFALIQTSDGGYVLAGNREDDILLLKTDANGTLLWSKTFDIDHESDYAYAVVETPNGDIAVGGYCYMSTTSSYDICLLKTNANGHLLWNQTYGTTEYENARSMVMTSDGGFALVGEYYNSTITDTILVKTNANGTLQWTQIYSTPNEEDTGASIALTTDGGLAICGSTYSYVTYSQAAFLIKTDANGTQQWRQTYGLASREYGYSVVAAGDGGYVIGGYAESSQYHSYDLMVLKTDSSGVVEWRKTYGEQGVNARARCVIATSDGGYAAVGYKSSTGGYGYDIFVVKTEVMLELGLAQVSSDANTLTVYRGTDDSYWQYIRVQIWKAD